MTKQQAQATQGAIGVILLVTGFFSLALGYQPSLVMVGFIALIVVANTGWILWTFIGRPDGPAD
jgi:hypothetical protein